MDVSVSELRTHLSHYLRLVKAGQSFRITNRGVVVALLTPPGPERR